LDPPHPVRIGVRGDLRRSRLTVFFRLLLAVPHFVWLLLWGIAAAVTAIASWFATLATGVSPAALHRFLGAYVRYQTHVGAFVTQRPAACLSPPAAPPSPGSAGEPADAVAAAAAPPMVQNRWTVGFRIFLALPALLVSGALNGLVATCAFLGWFYALATARMP